MVFCWVFRFVNRGRKKRVPFLSGLAFPFLLFPFPDTADYRFPMSLAVSHFSQNLTSFLTKAKKKQQKNIFRNAVTDPAAGSSSTIFVHFSPAFLAP